MSAMQLDLFADPRVCSSPPNELKRFGRADALTGLPLQNGYSDKLPRDSFAIYRDAYLLAARR